ncbi:hypothetical protein AK830_g3160 [Neonectria ditissima]|uniref:Uncharacterized protein n=1 Tax=Neonectria ditissima TaxID=78410 RepID=A0A0P7BRB5_9HYPO|nr:hypothetical protein AK830_g3160 [Neonectria ditissima]
MFSFGEMMEYCYFEANVGPGLDMDDVPCRPSAPVDLASTAPCSTSAPAPASASDFNPDARGRPGSIGFMDLPSEIRLHIYTWLHLMCPVRHAQLAPWYPTPVHCQYILRRVGETKPAPAATSPLSSPGLLSPFRPLSGLPTGLLQCSSQIYREARGVPFERNEFVFVNWFASGLWAARAFARALEPWQRADLRFVRLEILARDLVGGPGGSGDGAGHEEWLALCDDWAGGLRGLRMKMVLGGGAHMSVMAASPEEEEEELEKKKKKDGDGGEVLWAAARLRVAAGLRRLGRLERLEMELVSREMKDDDKARWCEVLEEELRAVDGLRGVRVVCTEKLQEKMEWIKRNVGLKHLQGLTEY